MNAAFQQGLRTHLHLPTHSSWELCRDTHRAKLYPVAKVYMSTCQEKAIEALQDSEGRVGTAEGEWHFIVGDSVPTGDEERRTPSHTPILSRSLR